MIAPDLARRAEARLWAEMESLAPSGAPKVRAWVSRLYGEAPLAELFTRPSAFPVLPLPWWVEESVAEPNQERQEELALSSMAGYLYIRLIDNIIDADAPADRRLLPMLGFFSTLFTRPYQVWFIRPHPFWDHFDRIWVGAADYTIQDAGLSRVDQATFRAVSGRKTDAAKIPVGAVLHLHGLLDRMDPWESFVEGFGRWHQLLNDLHSWRRDLESGAVTYLLTVASERRRPDESAGEWLLRDGLAWAFHTLSAWMEELCDSAEGLGSPGLQTYLDRRKEMLQAQASAAREGAAEGLKLARVMRRFNG